VASFEEIDQARRLLGLGEAATLEEIRQAYRRMAGLHHPDRCPEEEKTRCEELMKRLNEAYELLLDYCARYRYSFDEESVRRTYPFDEYLRRFYQGWFEGI